MDLRKTLTQRFWPQKRSSIPSDNYQLSSQATPGAYLSVEASRNATSSVLLRRRKVIVMLGTSASTKGGVSAVINAYARAGLFDRWPVVHIATHADGSQWQKARTALSALVVFAGLLIRGRVAFVHVHAASDASFWRKAGFVLLAFAAHTPAVFHLHGGGFLEFYHRRFGAIRRWLIRFVLDHADTVVVVSEQWRKKLHGLTKNRNLVVIVNPVDAIPVVGVDPNRPASAIVLFLGRIEKDKGVYDLVDAMAEVRRQLPTAILRLGGVGDIDGVKRRSGANGTADWIEFLGWVSDSAKLDALRSAQVYVLPSYVEGLPMGVLEAMAAGLPVVASHVGGIPDLVEDGVHGFLVRAGDIAGLAQTLLRLLQDPALRRRMGEAARQRVAECYVTERVVPQVESIYRRLLEKVEDSSGAAL